MSNTTNCSLTSIPQPPTTSAACAVPNVGNNSAILTSCCNTNGAAIIGSYGDANFNTASDCYSYCNITEQASSNNTVLTCIGNALGAGSDEVSCFGAKTKSAGGMSRAVDRVLMAGVMIVVAGMVVGS